VHLGRRSVASPLPAVATDATGSRLPARTHRLRCSRGA
jgi:hypothetical protein